MCYMGVNNVYFNFEKSKNSEFVVVIREINGFYMSNNHLLFWLGRVAGLYLLACIWPTRSAEIAGKEDLYAT